MWVPKVQTGNPVLWSEEPRKGPPEDQIICFRELFFLLPFCIYSVATKATPLPTAEQEHRDLNHEVNQFFWLDEMGKDFQELENTGEISKKES